YCPGLVDHYKEQRAIREQMREEEKARRDIEKARNEAEKEERMLAKAMEEARKQMDNASEAERLQFQERLYELEQQLEEAEARGQRALSMAQQTKRGHVYVISNIGSFGQNVLKIGMTRRLDPMDRVKELGDASVPFSFDVHAMIYSEDAPSLEKELHRRFTEHQVNRINPRKEFFNIPIKQVRQVIDEQGHNAHWTMKAEAQEYYESRAIAEKKEMHAVS
ncbi:GIY-YIG nuclease family protein, partial [Vreelandella lionensis]|uniref:GIY-YIG nuclease family protein n=1 Tax=Vreelandella lionensis TaxID=1144478 RepID=UPI00178D0458